MCCAILARGGLATSLCEIAVSSSVGIKVEADEVPVREEVKATANFHARS